MRELLVGPAPPSDAALIAACTEGGADPWLLSERLVAAGRPELAQRLAALWPNPESERLRQHLGQGPKRELLAAQAQRIDAALAAAEGEDWPNALATLEDGRNAGVAPSGALALHIERLRMRALLALQRVTEALDLGLATAQSALDLGWLGAAEELYAEVLAAGFGTQQLRIAAQAVRGRRTVCELRGDIVGVADAEQDWGTVLMSLGDFPGAERHLNEALAHFRALDMEEDAEDVLSARSLALTELAAFAAAQEDQRTLAARLDPTRPDGRWATNQVRLGVLRWRLGDGEGSSSAFEAARSAFRDLEDPAGEEAALGNLGLTQVQAGRWDLALETLRSVLAMAETREDAMSAALARLNLAHTLWWSTRTGLRAFGADVEPDAPATPDPAAASARLVEARDLAQAAWRVFDAASAASMAAAATLTLGQIALEAGELDQAASHLEQALKESRRLKVEQTAAEAYLELARCAAAQGRWEAALQRAHEGVDLTDQLLGALGEADLMRARARMPDLYDVGARAAVELDRPDDLAAFLEAGRAAALLRGLGGRAAYLRAAVPAALAMVVETRTQDKARRFVAYRIASVARDPNARALWKAYEVAREAEAQSIEDLTAAQSRAAARLTPARLVGLGDIQEQLKGLSTTSAPARYVGFGLHGETGYALVVEPEKARIVRLDAAALRSARRALDGVLTRSDGTLDPQALAECQELFVKPLGLPKGAGLILVSPDRELTFLPWAALLPQALHIAVVPSATTYELLAEHGLSRGSAVLALGDPRYRDPAPAGAGGTRGPRRHSLLPGTRAEVEAVTPGPDDKRLLDEKATRQGLIAALTAPHPGATWRCIHLACHGIVDPDRPELSHLALTPRDGDDGLLSALDVLRLPATADLTILSACQTSRGTIARAEGLLGLVRAFMLAGSPRVLASLWNVDDEATRFLMQRFYKHWNAGKGAALALRLAQQETRDFEKDGPTPSAPKVRPWADPKFWAAWVLWGLPD